MPGGTATARRAGGSERLKSADEMRELLDAVLTAVDEDPALGPRLRSAGVSWRYVFPDLGVTLNVAGSEEGTHNIRWSFDEGTDWQPSLTLEMSSEVANRYLQGRENLAIAMARGTIHCSCKSRAALELLPISRALNDCYRRVLERQAPRLLLA